MNCSGGRIVNYFEAMHEDERHDLLFVVYQAEYTAGRQIQRFSRKGG